MEAGAEKVIKTLRNQAWYRAKGELNCVLTSFWNGSSRPDQFAQFKTLMDAFVKNVEDHGLNE